MNTKRTRQDGGRHDVVEREVGEAGSAAEEPARQVKRHVAERDAIFAAMLDGIILYDARGCITRMNDVAAGILGYSDEECKLPVEERLSLLHFESEPGVPLPIDRNPIVRALHGEAVQSDSYTIHPSSRPSLRVRMTAAPLRNEDGRVSGAVATAEDVTNWYELRIERERLLAESQLRASQLDAVVSFVPHGLVVQGPKGDVRRMNAAASKILGRSVHELRGKSFEEQMVNMHVEKADGTPFEMQYFPSVRALTGETVRGVPVIVHRADDSIVWLLFSSSPVFDPEGRTVGAVNTFADITSLHDLRVQREAHMEELAQTASQLEAAFASMAQGVVITDTDGRVVRMNDAASRIIGHSFEEWSKHSAAERLKLIHVESPEGGPLTVDEIPSQRALRGEVIRDYRMRIRRPDGRAVWIWTAASPIIAADGRTLGAVMSMTDVVPRGAQ